MEPKSSVDKLLHSASGDGRWDSEGQFTLSREAALAKLAEFQLPFAEAWVLKLVQALVALDSGKPIEIALHSGTLSINCGLGSLDLQLLEKEFFNPELNPNPALSHLLSGLWAAGIQQKYTFKISKSQPAQVLSWDGESLQCQGTTETAEHGTDTLIFEPSSESWERESRSNRKLLQSAYDDSLIRALRQLAYTCPVPLTLNGGRLDSLLNCPSHGWSFKTIPVYFGLGDAERPKLRVPPGHLEIKPVESCSAGLYNAEAQDYIWLAKTCLAKLKTPQEGSVPFLLGLKYESADSVLLKANQFQNWQSKKFRSTVNWVRDGVVVQIEELDGLDMFCSLALFLSAEGLASDLTTFSLRDGSEKRERVQKAVRAVREQLQPQTLAPLNEAFSELSARRVRNGRIASGIFGLVSVGLFALGPAAGFVGVGMSAAIFTVASRPSNYRKRELLAWIADLQEGIRRLSVAD